MRRLWVLFMCLFLLSPVVGFASESTEFTIKDSVMSLHFTDGPSKKYLVWNECGRRMDRQDADVRADEYAQAITASIDRVREATGETIDPDIVVSVLFRESSNNQCAIGRQEVSRLTSQLGHVPDRDDLVKHLDSWLKAKTEASRACTGGTSTCAAEYLSKNYPQYANINGWDVGAAQYRWPGVNVNGRSVVLPSGEELKRLRVSTLLDYQVSIQMLVEDLAVYRAFCRENHRHYVKLRWGGRRELATDEAYFVHHNKGRSGWSDKYLKQVQAHLKGIRAARESVLVAISHGHSLVQKILWPFGFLTSWS